MHSESGLTLEERVVRLEQSLADIAARLDSTQFSTRDHGTAAPPPTDTSAADATDRRGFSPEYAPPLSAARKRRPSPPRPFATKSAEWWLARGGAVLTSLALILLYQYAVERNWITPLVRVLVGTAVGGALMISAARLAKRNADATEDAIGLREVLLGAALAAWYITAYAAAVFYQLIPFATARLLFLALTILGAWLALRERRSILALLALGVGFSTPQLLPSAAPFIPAFALFIAALTAVGLVLYLMRGWQSILWLTFIAFWWLSAVAISLACCVTTAGVPRIAGSQETARIAIALLIVAGSAAMTRVPVLRRKLIALGSSLYTKQTSSRLAESAQSVFARLVQGLTGYPGAAALDTPALWVISLSSPLLALRFLSWMWTSVPGAVWGIASLVLAILAYRLVSSAQNADDELTHVEATATALLSLAGAIWIADSLGSRAMPSSAMILIAASLHAFVAVYSLRASRFITARRLGLWTAGVALASVIFSEAVVPGSGAGGIEVGWTIAELTAVGVAVWMWWTFRSQSAPTAFPVLFGLSAYIALMLIDARVLGQIWPPLVTASYAIAGTAILIWARGRAEARTLRRLGGLTLIVVVARLIVVDLSGVETIWRVLLFLGCGALFLLTSHLLQTPRESARPEPVG